MSKTIRNTLFTAVVISLTYVGISWNKSVVTHRQPVATGSITLAAPVPLQDRINNQPDLPHYSYPLLP